MCSLIFASPLLTPVSTLFLLLLCFLNGVAQNSPASALFFFFRHPFSITSAPGDDYLTVHIRTCGDWTQELKRIFVENYFSPHVNRRASFSELGAAEPKRSTIAPFHGCFLYMVDKKLTVFLYVQHSLPKLLVDGPYGAPAQDFRNYDVLLLVGLGIGATPFISILRDLLNNIKLADELMVLLRPMMFPF